MSVTHPFTPSQLLRLRSEMEDDFARLLRSTDTDQVDDAVADYEGSSPEYPGSSVQRDASVTARSQAHLMAVTAALRRLDSGTYGECVRCGNHISFDRLVAMPEATLCSACSGT